MPPHTAESCSVTKTTTSLNTWSLFLGIALLQAGVGLQRPLLGLRAEDAGFASVTAALVMSAYYAGFLLGTRYIGRLLSEVGHIRTFAGLASTASSIVLLQGLWISPIPWGICRLIFGICTAALYVVAESWLNDVTTNQDRGRVLSVYMVVAVGATTIGQYSVAFASTAGFTLFAIASVLVSMALVPVALSRRSTAPTVVPQPVTFRKLYSVVPTGLIVCWLTGMTLGSFIGIGPIYGAYQGWTPLQIANFVGAPLLGSLIFQIPLGRLSDRVPRRGVMTFTSAGAAGLCLLLAFLDGTDSVSIVCLFLMGGLALPLYSMSVAYTNDWLEPEQRTASAALLVRVHGIGSFTGPLVTGLLLGRSLKVFFLFPFAVFSAATLYLLYRIYSHEAPDVDEQSPFQPFPLRSSRMIASMLGRRKDSH